MKNLVFFSLACLCLLSCVSPMPQATEKAHELPTPLARQDLSIWVDYLSNLDSMSSRELKNESDRLRRIQERAWDDELRLALANGLQSQKSHNYAKAIEALQPALSKIQGNSQLRSWLKLYLQQLTTLAQLDKELSEEKRQRSELEKKVKALSDIERDISERSKKSDIARPYDGGM